MGAFWKGVMRAAAVGLLFAVGPAGCWDRREVNDIAIVSGSALDKAGSKYRGSVQFPLAGQLGGPGGGGGGTGGGKSWYVDSGTGNTVKESNIQMQRSLSRHMYFAHRRVLIFGEELARDGISTPMDVTVRSPQNRMSALVVFSKGPGIDLLNTDAVLEQQPSEIVREITLDYMKKPRTIKHVINILSTEGLDLAAPYFIVDKTIVGDEGEAKPRVTVEGLAIFKDDKLVALLKGEQAKGVLWAMNQAKRPAVTVKSPKGEGYITVYFSENDTTLKPEVHGDDISMKIKIRAIGNVFENGSNYKATADDLTELTGAVSEQLKSDVLKGVKALQSNHSDACGFGDTLYRQKPKVWNKVKSKWYEVFSAMKVTVEVDIRLEHSGTTLDPAAKRKEMLQ